MRLTILGSGTSMGVPVIGCRCSVCTSDDTRNRRLRTSALLEHGETTLLIDAGPDLREQVLRTGLTHLDSVLLTHAHADHIGGIDDLRPFTMRSGATLPLYGDAHTIERVRHTFDYAFDPAPSLSTRPSLLTRVIDGPFRVGDVAVTPLDVNHGPHTITGYRFGPVGYITDASALPERTIEQLRGVELLVLNALRWKPHPLHFTVDEALGIVERIRPRETLFVHITHDLDHAEVNTQLPPWAQLAFDGQVVEVAGRND